MGSVNAPSPLVITLFALLHAPQINYCCLVNTSDYQTGTIDSSFCVFVLRDRTPYFLTCTGCSELSGLFTRSLHESSLWLKREPAWDTIVRRPMGIAKAMNKFCFCVYLNLGEGIIRSHGTEIDS